MALKALDVDDLVGMDLPEAKRLIFAKGWRYRVVRIDGKDLASAQTEDKRDDRVNLTVASDVVTDARIG
jgi:hypothetical protein